MFGVVFEMEWYTAAHTEAIRAGVAQLQALEDFAAHDENRVARRVSARRVHAPNGGVRVKVFLPRFGGPQLTTLLAVLFALNLLEIRAMLLRGPVPSVYDAGVRYRREPRGCEIWRTIAVLYRLGFGDCEDIATALAAWLVVVCGEVDARPVWKMFELAVGRLYHILTKRGSGVIEDACRALGMGS
jgi:hypothetical protein